MIKGRPIKISQAKKDKIRIWFRYSVPELSKKMKRIIKDPSAVDSLLSILGRSISMCCECKKHLMDPTEYLIKKTDRCSWELRCVRCDAYDLIDNLSKHKNIRLSVLNNFILNHFRTCKCLEFIHCNKKCNYCNLNSMLAEAK